MSLLLMIGMSVHRSVVVLSLAVAAVVVAGELLCEARESRPGVRRSEVGLMWWSRCCRFAADMICWVGIGEPLSAAHHSRCPVGWRPAAASVARQHRHPRPSRSCWSARKRSRCGHRRRHHQTRSAARWGTFVFLVVRLRRKRLCRECCRRRRSTRTSWRWHTGCRGGCRG
jgi:hypothetical protein